MNDDKYLLYGNQLAVVDVETTGLKAGYHELIQIAVVLLDENLEPVAKSVPFYTNILPAHPDWKIRANQSAFDEHLIPMSDIENAPESSVVADRLGEWIASLNLPINRSLMPIAHNYPFENSFLQAWLGWTLKDRLFHGHYRDTMGHALSINDRYIYAGEKPPFPKVSLGALCKHFGIVNDHAHDALADCLVTAKVYKALLEFAHG